MECKENKIIWIIQPGTNKHQLRKYSQWKEHLGETHWKHKATISQPIRIKISISVVDRITSQ